MGCLGYDRSSGSDFTKDLYELYEWRSMDLMTLGYVRRTIDELSFADIFSEPIEHGIDFYQSEYDRAMEEIYEERYAELEQIMAEYQTDAELSHKELEREEKFKASEHDTEKIHERIPAEQTENTPKGSEEL